MEIDTSNVSEEPVVVVVPRVSPPETQATKPSPRLLTNPAEAEQRLSVCSGCEHYRKGFKQCSMCGCFMPVKVRFQKASCPDGRW